jgi:hypothetical protein
LRKVLIVSAALAIVAPIFASDAVAEDLGPKQVKYEFRNFSSPPDVLNCTFATYISNFPAPELVSVLFRVDAKPSENMMFFSITTDVGEEIYQSGKPSFVQKIPIDQAEFLSNDFDSLGRLHSTLDDGGVLQSTADPEVFPTLLLDFQSGQFTIRFRRQGSASMRGYVVGSPVSDTAAASAQFGECVTNILALFAGGGGK